MNKCIIVGSGPSAKRFSPINGIPTIGVNGTIDWLRDEIDYWFTLDPSFVNLERLKYPYDAVEYFLAVSNPQPYIVNFGDWIHYLTLNRAPIFSKLEDGLFHRIDPIPDLGMLPFPYINSYSGSFNSAFGAIQLAHHLGFTDVLLIGVDGTTEERIEGGFSRNLSRLPEMIDSLSPYINIYNAGKLNCSKVKKVSMRSFLDAE